MDTDLHPLRKEDGRSRQQQETLRFLPPHPADRARPKKAQNNKLEVVERTTPKRAPEDSLQNDVREADRLGVSYGKYRAWKDGRIHIHG